MGQSHRRTLYVSDLDGTLLNSRARLSERTIRTVNSLTARGVLFTYATARSHTSAYPVTKELSISLPATTYNGAALISHSDGRYYETCPLDREQVAGILDALRGRHAYPLSFAFIGGRERVSWMLGHENAGVLRYLSERPGDRRQRGVDSYDALFEGELFAVTMIGTREEMEALRPVYAENPHISFHISTDAYKPDEYWLEMFRHDATKAHALRKLKAFAGADEVVCFGDNINDIPMFEAADRAYAVANAREELKAIATGIIGGNDEDGVAEWLEGNA